MANLDSFQCYLEEIVGLEEEMENGSVPMGYPMNHHRTGDLAPFHTALSKSYVLNNCGDPFSTKPASWTHQTFHQERVLLEYIMKRWGTNPDEAWGYITTGGTEGVTKGIAAGYGRLKGGGHKKILVVQSAAAHYSVPKAISYLDGRSPPAVLPVDQWNRIDISAFRTLIETSKNFFGYDAVLVVACLGTTFFGGVDDVAEMTAILGEYGYFRGKNAYIHLDAALHGGFWPDYAELNSGILSLDIGRVIDSVNISGHKWWGGFVAGIVLVSTQSAVEEELGNLIEYVGMVDKFVSGSRSGAVPVLWYARIKQFDWKAELTRCIENARYAQSKLL